MIVKLSPHEWQVRSEKGKNLGTYKTEKEAKKRLQQVEYFKHKNHSEDQKYFVSLKNFEDKTFAYVKGPVYGFNEAKSALLNLMMANRKDFSEGIVRPWQSEKVSYRIRLFDEHNYKEKFKSVLKRVDPDLLESAVDGKNFAKGVAKYGGVQLIKTIKDPKNYKVYAKEAVDNIESSIEKAPEYLRENPKELMNLGVAVPVATVSSVATPIPGVGAAMGAATYTATDYAQRKVRKIKNFIKEGLI